MDRPGHNDAKFFLGTEVEHSPAFGMNTLFVIGVQSMEDIEHAIEQSKLPIQHIYFGANQSFPILKYNDADAWRRWENMILPFLGRGYWCTLDLDVSCIPGLTDGALCEQDRFIPMISVKMPYVRLLGYNATLKIDDINFAHSNPGVWCHSLHHLQSRRVFTDWSKYTKDQVID